MRPTALTTTGRSVVATSRVVLRGEFGRFGRGHRSEVASFERELATAMQAEYALAVNSGTSALVAALVGVGVGPGDEVLIPAYTWVSTAAAALAVGAAPVLVEVDRSLTLDPVDLKRKITPQSRAVVPVHMQNLVCDMDAIMAVAGDHGLTVIEDACQAIGATYDRRRAGAIGHIGCFSFNQHKNIRSGEGGAVVTDDRSVYERAAMYHDVGSYTRNGVVPDADLIVGVNMRMPELSAAVLRPQVAALDAQMARRRRHRRLVARSLFRSPWRQLGLHAVPHHDPAEAVGLAVAFDDPSTAAAFARNRGVHRPIDTGRHVYLNWQSVRARNPVQPATGPDRSATRDPELGPEACPVTLDVLARSCTVDLAPEMPTPLVRALARRLADPGQVTPPSGAW